MPTIGLFFGSSLDNTKDAAYRIKAEFKALSGTEVEIFDVGYGKLKTMENYDFLLVGIPTWDVGNLQGDWESAFPQIADLDLSNKRLALFGCGDQGGYPETFQDGIGILGQEFRARGATLVGYWPTDSYDFIDSVGLEGGLFMGLALDNVIQPELTEERIVAWVEQVAGEFGLL